MSISLLVPGRPGRRGSARSMPEGVFFEFEVRPGEAARQHERERDSGQRDEYGGGCVTEGSVERAARTPRRDRAALPVSPR